MNKQKDSNGGGVMKRGTTLPLSNSYIDYITNEIIKIFAQWEEILDIESGPLQVRWAQIPTSNGGNAPQVYGYAAYPFDDFLAVGLMYFEVDGKQTGIYPSNNKFHLQALNIGVQSPLEISAGGGDANWIWFDENGVVRNFFIYRELGVPDKPMYASVEAYFEEDKLRVYGKWNSTHKAYIGFLPFYLNLANRVSDYVTVNLTFHKKDIFMTDTLDIGYSWPHSEYYNTAGTGVGTYVQWYDNIGFSNDDGQPDQNATIIRSNIEGLKINFLMQVTSTDNPYNLPVGLYLDYTVDENFTVIDISQYSYNYSNGYTFNYFETLDKLEFKNHTFNSIKYSSNLIGSGNSVNNGYLIFNLKYNDEVDLATQEDIDNAPGCICEYGKGRIKVIMDEKYLDTTQYPDAKLTCYASLPFNAWWSGMIVNVPDWLMNGNYTNPYNCASFDIPLSTMRNGIEFQNIAATSPFYVSNGKIFYFGVESVNSGKSDITLYMEPRNADIRSNGPLFKNWYKNENNEWYFDDCSIYIGEGRSFTINKSSSSIKCYFYHKTLNDNGENKFNSYGNDSEIYVVGAPVQIVIYNNSSNNTLTLDMVTITDTNSQPITPDRIYYNADLWNRIYVEFDTMPDSDLTVTINDGSGS